MILLNIKFLQTEPSVHAGENALERMRNGAVLGVRFTRENKEPCITCLSRLPFENSEPTTSAALELVHSDLCGPMEERLWVVFDIF